MSWVEIGPASAKPAFTALAEALRELGVAEAGSFVAVEHAEEVAAAIAQAKQVARSIRVAQRFAVAASVASEEYPVLNLSLQAADFIQLAEDRWWPRNALFEGIQRSVAHDLGTVDVGSPVLVLGASSASRAAIAALVRIGFGRFNCVDVNDSVAEVEVARLTRSFFRTRFERTSFGLVTQLPGVHGVVVNGIESLAPELCEALLHMNYLMPGAAWIELFPGVPNSPLIEEARGAGARVELGSRVVARADAVWCESAFGVELDITSRAAELQSLVEVVASS